LGTHGISNQCRKVIIVAPADFLVGNHIILVDHGNNIHGKKFGDRLTDIHETNADIEIIPSKEYLGTPTLIFLKTAVKSIHESNLAAAGDSHEGVNILRPLLVSKQAETAGNRP